MPRLAGVSNPQIGPKVSAGAPSAALRAGAGIDQGEGAATKRAPQRRSGRKAAILRAGFESRQGTLPVSTLNLLGRQRSLIAVDAELAAEMGETLRVHGPAVAHQGAHPDDAGIGKEG